MVTFGIHISAFCGMFGSMERWAQAPLFRGLTAASIARLSAMKEPVSIKRKEILYHGGDPCEGFYVLVKGRIRLSYPASENGKSAILRIISPVNTFGETALFAGQTYFATAEALEDSKLFIWPKDPFLATLTSDHEMNLGLMHAQAIWIRHLAQKLQRVEAEDAQTRLMEWLQDHARPGLSFRLDIPKGLLAEELGMARETLSRQLRKLQDQGFLKMEGSRLTLLSASPTTHRGSA